MINEELRSQGIGASEVAAILGLDPRRDAFAVWARKLKLVDEPESNIRMRKGRYFEQGIVRWYEDETDRRTEWSDTTIQNQQRPWQVATPDAYVIAEDGDRRIPMRIGGVDAKMIAFDQRDKWGEPGTVDVPDQYALQCQWTASALDLPWWDIAAAIGDELRVYRIHRDPAIEAVLLETVDKFWRDNILARTQPPIGATDVAKEYIKKLFPKNIEPLREATPEEIAVLARFKTLYEAWTPMEKEYTELENQIKLMIGDGSGLTCGLGLGWRFTYNKDKDSTGTDWRALAHDLAQRIEVIRACAESGQLNSTHGEIFKAVRVSLGDLPSTMQSLESRYQIITRKGPRKLRPTFGKGK